MPTGKVPITVIIAGSESFHASYFPASYLLAASLYKIDDDIRLGPAVRAHRFRGNAEPGQCDTAADAAGLRACVEPRWTSLAARRGSPIRRPDCRSGLCRIQRATRRHSFASLAADLGYSEPAIAALVGHKGHSTTSRYLHAADAVLLAAADTVAQRTAELMGEP